MAFLYLLIAMYMFWVVQNVDGDGVPRFAFKSLLFGFGIVTAIVVRSCHPNFPLHSVRDFFTQTRVLALGALIITTLNALYWSAMLGVSKFYFPDESHLVGNTIVALSWSVELFVVIVFLSGRVKIWKIRRV